MALKLGLMLGYSGRHINIDYAQIQRAESLGFDSVWTAESWGSDAVSPLAWIGPQSKTLRLGTSIMQMPGRSPANTAMTALTLQQLSGGRFVLGLGTSGPQVVEGWHGKPWHKPLSLSREYISIVKKIFAREEKLDFSGEFFDIPYRGEHSKGLGKPLKSMIHPTQPVPIHLGSMSPKGQALAGELCDGLHLTCLIPEKPEVIIDPITAGFSQRQDGKAWQDFEVITNAPVVVLNNPRESLDAAQGKMYGVKMGLALYIGGMGTKNKNFYKEYFERAGFESEANTIQSLFLSGKQEQAVAAVSDDMVRSVYLVGTRDEIAERFSAWQQSPLTSLLLSAADNASIEFIAELNSTQAAD